ncbi:MAG: permease-like cell division protein FtsX [Xanthomonadales bacterium]|nr:permease-like cell division protein FtsX [Xanthomonadales bacterium]
MNVRGFRRRLRAWGRQQLYSFFSSLGFLLSHRLGTLMTVLVLGIAMALPMGLYVGVKNLHALDLKQENWGTITAFLRVGVQQAGALELARNLAQQHGAAAETVSPARGMEEFREASGFGQALDMFEDNPLPWVLHVTPPEARDAGIEASVAAVVTWLEQQEQVDFVQVDYKWLERLASLLDTGDALVTVLAVLLSLAVVVVVANTIRLDVSNRAGEIQVLNMVGASNGFIRQPFLYSGFWYGLMGAVLALLLLHGSLVYLQVPLGRLLDAYGNTFEVRGLGVFGTAIVLFGGGGLGLLGSWAAVRRHLRQFRLEEMPRRK